MLENEIIKNSCYGTNKRSQLKSLRGINEEPPPSFLYMIERCACNVENKTKQKTYPDSVIDFFKFQVAASDIEQNLCAFCDFAKLFDGFVDNPLIIHLYSVKPVLYIFHTVTTVHTVYWSVPG